MRRSSRVARLLLAAAFAAPGAQAQERGIPLDQLKSGSEFLGQDLRALQADEFANPGMLWVERGAKLWREPAGKKSLACASCHQEVNMRWVAARYPRIDSRSGKLLNLEGRINLCRAQRMGAEPLRYESDELLALTAYLARQSRGVPTSGRRWGRSSAGCAPASLGYARRCCPTVRRNTSTSSYILPGARRGF